MLNSEKLCEFQTVTAGLMESGYAGPGARVLGYLFGSREEERSRIDRFTDRIQTILLEDLDRMPADKSTLSRIPNASIWANQDTPSVIVIVNNEEARGIALTHIGRPAYQTVVPMPGR